MYNKADIPTKRLLILLFFLLSLCGTAFAEYSNDLEWLTQEGHPTFYGSTTQAHSVWSNVEDEKIIFADSFDRYEAGKTILIMDARKNEKYEIIRHLEVYFKNCNPPVQITIDEAVDIANEYFPHEIANKWYEHDRSFYQPAKSNSQYSYYICYYHLTEDASTAYYNKEHPYSGSMTIVFSINSNGYVDLFHYTFGTPDGIGDPATIDWDVDFMKMQ